MLLVPAISIAVFILMAGVINARVIVPTSSDMVVVSGRITDVNNGGQADGYYLAFINCPVDMTIKVDASKNGGSGSNTGDIETIYTFSGSNINIGISQVDVAIPEFSSIVAPVLASVASFGIVSAVKKKKSQQ
jgi:hypothetical protein